MNRVHVLATTEYDVVIGKGLLSDLGAYVSALIPAGRICIVSDTNVWPLYGIQAKTALHEAGFSVTNFIFQAGEAQKNPATYLQILNHLAENGFARTDLIIALGGGVTGDLAGFAAATYMRGIPYIQIPTTLLAAVDSSVGGKTAIDLPMGKNLAGAFYQPGLVLCDTDCLSSLPDKEYRNGCAEIIKYAILFDPELFWYLMDSGTDFDRESVITRCVQLKRDVVAMDEFDRSERAKLNFGHTVGHGIEAASNFEIPHGYAVAAGMAIVSRAAANASRCSAETAEQILEILDRFGLPTTCCYGAESLYRYALSDKKRIGDCVNLIIPDQIGHCSITAFSVEHLQSFIEAGL